MGVDAISAISIVGPLRAGVHDRSQATRGSMTRVHQCGDVGPSYPPPFHTAIGTVGPVPRWPGSARGLAGRRIERADLAAKPGQDEAATDELRGRDHVRMGDPPGDHAVRFDREGLQLGLD